MAHRLLFLLPEGVEVSRLSRLQLFVFLFAAIASGGFYAYGDEAFEFSFKVNRGLNLRDSTLKISPTDTKDSMVTIDPEFLKVNLDTDHPTSEQIKEFLTSPNRFSDEKVKPRKFFDSTAKVWRWDYFFPVNVKKADGSIVKGQMALPAAFRMGHVTLKMKEVQARRSTATQKESLKIYLQNEDPTQVSPSVLYEMSRVEDEKQTPVAEFKNEDAVAEGQVCQACYMEASSSHNGQLQPIAMSKVEVQASKNLRWENYSEFAKNFSEKYRRKINSNSARVYKRLFVQSLIETFGPTEAGYMIQALTAFGESADRVDDNAQLAELAAVTMVVENRAQTNTFRKSRILRDIGVNQTVDARLSAALANGQFSVWNDGDNNLSRILAFHPEKSNPMAQRRMSMAFEAQQMMSNQEITFVGQMANPQIQHYHAEYTRPAWASSNHKITEAVVRIKDENQYVDVNLAQQSGARHIFYAGLR